MNDGDPKLADEIARLRAIEREKQHLLDKSIGGPNALRPSDDYILKRTGPLKSDSEIVAEARNNRRLAIEEEARAAANRLKVEQSMKEHNARLEARANEEKRQEAQTVHKPDMQSIKDKVNQRFQDQQHNRSRSPDHDI